MGSFPIIINNSPGPIYGLQLGIDNKIYAVNFSGTLGTIENPNILGSGANYVPSNITSSSGASFFNLPQLVPEIFINENVKTKFAKKPVIQGNPFKEELKIKFKFIQTYTVDFYNSTGALSKTVVYDEMTNRKPYKGDTSDLPQDTYYLIIRDKQSQIWYETVVKIE